ncbi:MAG: hypothetical protein WKF43_14565 [Acidimicrobiales bacterium]
MAAILGTEAVVVPEWRGGRGPVEQLALVPAAAVDLTGPRVAARPGWVAEPWPGRLPTPLPAVIHPDPPAVDLLDGDGHRVVVTGRGVGDATPATVVVDGVARAVGAWAGPWPADERWWDPPAIVVGPRAQVVDGAGEAHLLVVEDGRWWLEATYD